MPMSSNERKKSSQGKRICLQHLCLRRCSLLNRTATVLKEHFSSVGLYLNKLPTIQHNYFDFFLNVTNIPINSFDFDLVIYEKVKLKISCILNDLMESLMVYILVFKCSANVLSSILGQIKISILRGVDFQQSPLSSARSSRYC